MIQLQWIISETLINLLLCMLACMLRHFDIMECSHIAMLSKITWHSAFASTPTKWDKAANLVERRLSSTSCALFLPSYPFASLSFLSSSVCLSLPPVSSACVSWTHTWRDLADRGRVPTITLITVGALHKDGAVAETLGKHFSSNVIQPDASTLREKKSENSREPKHQQ